MKLKRLICISLISVMALGLFTSCKKSPAEQSDNILKFAAVETAYGADVWQEIKEAFEAAYPGVTVELNINKNIEDIISSQMQAGNYPDVIHLATGREKAMTETFIKDSELLDITDVFTTTIPGEDVTPAEKLIAGMLDTAATNPYDDNKTYLAPMFYSPCGLFYDAGLFKKNGWEVPTTWDEMFELGDKAREQGIYLFTYPHSGYFDAFMYALLREAGDADFYNSVLNYGEGVWDSDEAKKVFDLVAKLKDYTEPTTVANSNDENFRKNQQLVIENKALFMPNGTWVVDEMADTPRSEDFEWGFMALPALEAGGDRYSYTFIEQMWIPKQATNQDMAKKFINFMYSDTAVDIFKNHGAIQPVKDISDKLEGINKTFYSIYDNGAKAVMGVFATTDPVEGVSIKESLLTAIDSVMSGAKTVDQWKAGVIEASDKLRAALK